MKRRVRWWMWALLSLACLALSIRGALTDDAGGAIYGGVTACMWAFFAGLLLMHEDHERDR